MLSRVEGGGPRGQVLVEVLLVLPIFLFLIFTIMEIGHLAFRTILLHHAAYEVARIGSLTAQATAAPTCNKPGVNFGIMQAKAFEILPGSRVIPIGGGTVGTLPDPQEGCMNYDVSIEMRQAVPMIFPMTGLVLANQPGRRARMLRAQVRMPVERPLFK